MNVLYRHTTLATNKVFYIGIGKLKRAHSVAGRSLWWYKTVAKHGYYVEILKKGLTWEDACDLERTLITYYGRRDLGLGTLVNLTDGGEGTVNWSKEAKERARQLNLGIPKTEEHKAKLRKPKKGIRVVDTVTGIVYPSVDVAATTFGLAPKNLSRYLMGSRKNKTNLKYYAEIQS